MTAAEDMAEARRALLEAARVDVPSPRDVERIRSLAAALPPGAWTEETERAVRDWFDELPECPAGVACFPAVASDGRVREVRVDVQRRGALGPDQLPDGLTDEVRGAVAGALGAARALDGAPDVAFVVRFSPAEGWTGASCGLAVALAAVSSLRGRPLQRRVWSTGAVTEAGAVQRVEGIEAKRRASAGRILIEPSSDGAHAVASLAAAGGLALGLGDPYPVVREVWRRTDAWREARMRRWGVLDAREPVSPEDESIERWRRSGGAALVVSGGLFTLHAHRLVRLVAASDRGRELVLAVAPEGEPAALARAIAEALGPAAPRDDDLAAQVDRLAELGALSLRPVLLVVDPSGDPLHTALSAALRGLAARARGGLRLAWTEPSHPKEADEPAVVTEVRCTEAPLSLEAVRRALPEGAWTPESRLVLQRSLAGRVLPRLAGRDWRAPLLHVEVLRRVFDHARDAAGPEVDAATWEGLLRRLEQDDGGPWSPPRGLASSVDALCRIGVLRRVDGGFQPADAALEAAIRAEGVARTRLTAWNPLPAPAEWRAAWRRESRRVPRMPFVGGPLFPWNPFEDALVGACLGLGEDDADAVRAWAADCGAVLPEGGDDDVRRAALALLASVARADLLRGDGVAWLPFLAEALPRPVRAWAAGALVLALVYDAWPVALHRLERARWLIARVTTALASTPGAASALQPLDAVLAGDTDALLEAARNLGDIDAFDDDVAWPPIVHLAVFQDWELGRDVPGATAFGAWQEQFRRVYHARCSAEPGGDWPEEVVGVAWGALRRARRSGDAESERWWRARVAGEPPEEHSLGPRVERDIARALFARVVLA